MPDDEVAVAEKLGEAVETPTIETPKAEEKAVPPSDQEQEVPETPDSGDQKVADEALTAESAVAKILDRLDEAAKDNPDIAAELEKRRPKPTADVEEQKLQWELDKNAQVRTASWQQAQTNSNQYTADNVVTALEGVFDQFNEETLTSATALSKGEIEDPSRVQVDAHGWAGQVLPYVQRAQASAYVLAQEAAKGVVLDTLEKHSSHKYMSTDDRAKYQAAVQSNQLGVALKLQLDAAGQAAPQIKEIAQKATAKAQEDAGLIAELNKHMENLGPNGKKPVGGGGAKSEPSTLEEVDEALRTGPTKDYEKNMAKRAALLGQ